MLIQKVDDYHVVLLPVAVTPTDSLFDPLGVPRQVIVNDQRAKLEVDSFRACFGGDHHRGSIPEVLDKGCPEIYRLRACRDFFIFQ